ncbi:hypothetical protein G6F57_017698 [Rhizopus arrhizus]|nr:hypothetical protein G6F57_017698 [Rhizopus arrhizus]
MKSDSVFRPSTRTSPTRIVPRCGRSSPVMQRKIVDLPDPDGPMMDTACPCLTSTSMPLSTSVSPKARWTSRRLTSDQDGEVAAGDGVAGDSGGVDQVVHAHQRGQRGAHGDAGHQVHPGRQHPPHALRQHDHPEDLRALERQRLRGLPLRAGNRLDRATEDLGHVGAGRQPQTDHDFDPVGKRQIPPRQVHLEREHIGREIHQHQDWRVAKQQHVGPRQAP